MNAQPQPATPVPVTRAHAYADCAAPLRQRAESAPPARHLSIAESNEVVRRLFGAPYVSK